MTKLVVNSSEGGIMNVLSLALYLRIFYAALVLIVVSLMVFYVRGLTTKGETSGRLKAVFYGWLGFLVAVAILFHLLTAWQIPWVRWEIKRAEIVPNREFALNAKQHRFTLPAGGLKVRQGEVVKFKVTSSDLTYGFGVFHESGAMEFQMQVLPGHSNEIIWIFKDPGKYSIRSTEYAGPETEQMYLKDSITVLSGEEK
ncbi:hypothetical protein A3J44_05960 [candidate division WOR-1 bacterium RIFCSPHIGHO2_02_FULL_45_12]|nr:MAG: hypothetical protein A3J44_05960 [candidate division WOR-1 bacterium RIFCSPHIGHO2_02_FULL_45_12]